MIAVVEARATDADADADDAPVLPPRSHARSHARAGATPNLYLGASERGGRRALGRRLIALPHASRLATTPRASVAAQHARQGSELWSRLHTRGLLTTARFADALGLREPRAAASLGGVPSRLAGRGALHDACRHLAGGGGEGRDSDDDDDDNDARATADARRRNAQAHWHVNFGGDRGHGGAEWTSDDDDDCEPLAAEGDDNDAACRHHRRQQRRDAHSRAAAARGPSGVAMAWGLAQEWASLHELSRVFPHSLVEECGLRLVDKAMLPAPPPGDDEPPLPLPRLGASPDAILAHAIRLDATGADALLRQWRARLPPALADALRLADDDNDDDDASPLWSSAAPAFVAAAGEAAARLVARRMWGDALRLVAVADGSSTPRPSEREGDDDEKDDGCTSALARELSAAASLLDALLAPGDLARAFERRCRRRRRRKPAAYDSADEEDERGACCDDEDNEDRRQLAARRAAYRAALRRAMDEEDDEDDDAPPLPLPACCFVSRAGSGSRSAPKTLGHLLLREAVEIKNSSPFRGVSSSSSNKGGGGGGGGGGSSKKKKKANGKSASAAPSSSSRFLLADPGPRSALPPIWAPQAQLHCLATALPSLLLMQRSATRGAVVWRVARDDEWMGAALGFVRRLVEAPTPPRDSFLFFDGDRSYGPFLAHTRRVARGAGRVAETRGSGGLLSSEEEEGEAGRRRRRRRCARDVDRRFFVDDDS